MFLQCPGSALSTFCFFGGVLGCLLVALTVTVTTLFIVVRCLRFTKFCWVGNN